MRTSRPAAATTPSTGSLLGEWIRKNRLDQGISQRALADRSGLSRSYVCDIERGRGAEPSMATLDKLAAALGTSRADLMAAAGLIEPPAKGQESDDERRLLQVFRDLSDDGQATAMRFVRFLQADEQRWSQPNLLDGFGGDGVHEHANGRAQGGPMLFDLEA
ncbi:MAG: helix-turn-helix transcriptional regulator [Thermomicrobiales bacterium]